MPTLFVDLSALQHAMPTIIGHVLEENSDLLFRGRSPGRGFHSDIEEDAHVRCGDRVAAIWYWPTCCCRVFEETRDGFLGSIPRIHGLASLVLTYHVASPYLSWDEEPIV
jgi:hypothetical protein